MYLEKCSSYWEKVVARYTELVLLWRMCLLTNVMRSSACVLAITNMANARVLVNLKKKIM
jgi:hypothetical protein